MTADAMSWLLRLYMRARCEILLEIENSSNADQWLRKGFVLFSSIYEYTGHYQKTYRSLCLHVK